MYYMIEDKKVIVFGFFHCARDPYSINTLSTRHCKIENLRGPNNGMELNADQR